MARTHYHNGDEIGLHCGCDGCSPSMINGVFCHEAGCPEAWRDTPKACWGCGCDFLRESRFDMICPDCSDPDDRDYDELPQVED